MSKQQRVSRKEQRRQQREQEQRMKLLRLWGPIAIVVIGFIVFAAIRIAGQQDMEGVTVVQTAPGGDHDSDLVIDFGGLPPMGGPHNPVWQNCGIYDTAVAAQYAIHSMEHGAVWVTYNPDIDLEEISALQDMARGDNYLLLAPYPDQSSPIALTVWDRQLTVDSASDGRIEEFVTTYRRARGPERSAACSNGRGVPVG